MAVAIGHTEDCPGCSQEGQLEHRWKPAPAQPSTAVTTAWLCCYLFALVLTPVILSRSSLAGGLLLLAIPLVWITATVWHLVLHKSGGHVWCHLCTRQRYREYLADYERWENEQRGPHGLLANELSLYRES